MVQILNFRIAFSQITKGRQTNYCKRQGPSEMTQHLTLGSLWLQYHIRVAMSDGKIVYNFNCPVTHCSNNAQAESNLASDINICESIFRWKIDWKVCLHLRATNKSQSNIAFHYVWHWTFYWNMFFLCYLWSDFEYLAFSEIFIKKVFI